MLRTCVGAVALLGLVTATVVAQRTPAPASLTDRDVVRFLAKRGLVTLCGPTAVDDVDLQPGAYVPGAPCLAQADLDGDGSNDLAVLVAERAGKRRAGVLIKAKGAIVLFGAGATPRWRVRTEVGTVAPGRAPADLQARAALRPYTWRGTKPAQAAGATVELSGGDASMAIFSDGRAWYTTHLGF